VAAAREQFGFIGIEREPEYFAIAEQRIKKAQAESASLFSPLAAVM
jgi:DNA modification methylase